MISKLPPEIQSAFRTGITITSLPHCVIELILNSLDANASHIGVRIDLEKYNLQVVDNGCGIERAQLELVGERYMTSKCSSLADLEGNVKYYGFRGEAVASIKDVCEAMVLISRPEGHSSTFSKVMKGGSEINSRVSKAMLNRPGNGTTVAVTNLFYNLPVRRHRMYSAIELEQLRHQMQAIALIHPKVCEL
ncbi:DNA mismatch repair protein Mlh3-like [Nilaparvata lugens]|uniref:DNA mismatch repair protein Mlh3-like n=1 Tax=Nilaparvata lugens TaxID=108931 RepID=UPI00193E236D|nr:DNA mismatch repair protein Mlh3-like [Nilaparvata lugens]